MSTGSERGGRKQNGLQTSRREGEGTGSSHDHKMSSFDEVGGYYILRLSGKGGGRTKGVVAGEMKALHGGGEVTPINVISSHNNNGLLKISGWQSGRRKKNETFASAKRFC